MDLAAVIADETVRLLCWAAGQASDSDPRRVEVGTTVLRAMLDEPAVGSTDRCSDG